MHYLTFSYQIPLVKHENLLVYAIIKYHSDEKLSNKIAQCSVAGSVCRAT